MKKSLACSLALATLGLAPPLKAETVYIPVLEPVNAQGAPLPTQLWLSNFESVERPYATAFLQADGDKAQVKSDAASVPGDRGVYLSRVADPGETGLLAIEAAPELAVDAWVKSTHGKDTFYAGLPVISADTRVPAGEAAYLNGVGRLGNRDVTQLALVNLGEAASQCEVDQVAADGSLARGLGSIEVPAKSMSRFEDALGLRGEPAATVRVSCDQPFYALAALADARTSEVSFVSPAAEIETVKAEKARNPATASRILFNQTGLFHTATRANPKRVLRVPAARQFSAERISAEFDVKAGPWNPRLPRGAHNLIWLHRGRFRGNTLANLNAFGPGNNKAKAAQNIDLPAKYSTSTQFGFAFQQGQTYHVATVYDARNRTVSFTISQKGRVLKSGSYDATARNNLLTVPGSGLVAEFGNYNDQELPEVSSLGWSFFNLRVEILPAV